MICAARQLKARKTENTVNLQNMSVSGSGNNTFLKIYWAGNHQKGAISGPGNLQKAREILYRLALQIDRLKLGSRYLKTSFHLSRENLKRKS